MGIARIAAVVGSLAALAIILSPFSPLPPQIQLPNQPGPNAGIPNESEEIIDEEAIAPAEVAEVDFQECNSLNDGIQHIILYNGGQVKNETREIAADLLLGEYCNRPALVHEISAMANPGLALTAYACDAASGKVGDSQLKDSLADHTQIYCDSATVGIIDESESLLLSIEGFKEGFLVQLVESDDGSADSEIDIAQVNATLDEVSDSANGAKALVQAGQYYEAEKMLEKGSELFEDLLTRIEEEPAEA